jgi:2-desacetyl-2-hydroxyethyl bacteriochlorophyllide A dehydrogenase
VKAAVIQMIDGHKKLQTEELPTPEIGPTGVLVHVTAAGICGSDLHGFLDDEGTSRRPGLIMSHEAAGIVAAVGNEVTRLSVGDRVTVDPQVTCGVCLPCRRGWISICDNKRVTGSSLRGFEQGAMAEYLAVEEKQVFVIPDSMSMEEAAMIEPLSNALHVVNRAGLQLGQTVVILGAGTLGLCMVQAVALSGVSNVIVSDTSDFRLEVASGTGATKVVNPMRDDLRSVVAEITRGLGADVVIESVGIDATYQDAIQIVRKRGRVMFFGAVQDTVTLPLLPILHKEIDIVGCTGANDETSTAIDLVAAGKIDLRPIITHEYALDEAQSAFDVLSDRTANAIKVQVRP